MAQDEPLLASSPSGATNPPEEETTEPYIDGRPSSSTALLPQSHTDALSADPDTERMSSARQPALRRNSAHAAGSEDPELRRNHTDLEMDKIWSDEETLLADDEETGLTEPERKNRRRRKMQNARLDGQVSGAASMRSQPGSVGTTEEKLATTTLLKNIIINAVLIGLWYCFSISISVYNKWMFSGENLNFPFPLFTTSMHMLVQFSLASAVLFFLPQFRPSNATISDPHDSSYSRVNTEDDTEHEPLQKTHNPSNSTTTNQPLMTKFFYLTRIGPCGAATALDIGLGNFSLRFISLTFFTMCKSSVLGFVLLFAFIFRLEHPTWRLILIIFFMTIGVIMMVAGETAFDALGFVLVMLASFCSGFRWSLTQILLLRNRATSNPFSSIFFLTPVMFLALFLLALPIEGPTKVVQGVKDLAASEGGFQSFLLLLFPGILAFCMVSAEFALLKRTSVVTLSVCGIFKEVLTISAAGAIFGDELSPINVSGLFVTIASIAAYNYLKYSKMKKEAVQEAHEIIVESREEQSSSNANAVTVGHDGTAERRGSSHSPLMQDLQSDGNPSSIGHDVRAFTGSPVKRPEHLK